MDTGASPSHACVVVFVPYPVESVADSCRSNPPYAYVVGRPPVGVPVNRPARSWMTCVVTSPAESPRPPTRGQAREDASGRAASDATLSIDSNTTFSAVRTVDREEDAVHASQGS